MAGRHASTVAFRAEVAALTPEEAFVCPVPGHEGRDRNVEETDIATDRPLIERAAQVVGLAFLLVGIAGFIPGITTHLYGGLKFAGHKGDAQLLGIFDVSVLHNLVHLLFGIAGLTLGRTWRGARAFLLGGGAIYLVLWIYGLLIDQSSGANFVPLDDADNWLHFGLGAAMIALGLGLARGRRATRSPAADTR
jgi:hypothetical protein